MSEILRAVLLSGTFEARYADLDGKRWWTNGYLAIPNDEIEIDGATEYPPLAALVQRMRETEMDAAEWRGLILREAVPWSSAPAVLRELRCADERFWFDEALVSVFGTELEVKYAKDMAAVVRGGEVCGLLMRTRYTKSSDDKAVKSVPAETIYRHFACERNGWFMNPDGAAAALSKEIEELEDEIADKHREMDDCESELNKLSRRRKKLVDKRKNLSAMEPTHAR